MWIHLRKEHFPSKRNNKLMPRAEGSFEVLEKVNDNIHKVDLQGDFIVLATFNVANLSPYLLDDYLADFRIKSSHKGRMMAPYLAKINIQSPKDSSHFAKSTNRSIWVQS